MTSESKKLDGELGQGTRVPSASLSGGMSQGILFMKFITALFVIVAFACAANGAEAKGCLKGAVVGGVAGHYAGHHGMLGAAAGCLYGRHRAKEQERQQQSQDNGNNGM
jgi:hypothetical protein